MKRIGAFFLALLLALGGQAHAQLALTGAGLALAPSGGGGGGGTPTFSAGASKAFAYSALSDTTASFTPGGSDRFMAGGLAGREPSAPPPGLGDFKYGGSGGTSLALLSGSTQTLSFGAATVGTYWAVGTPSGSTTAYGLLTGSSLGSNMGAVAYENVNQTTPWDSHTYNSGTATGTTTVMSVTITGISSGDVAIARGACTYLDNGGTAFTEVAGTTIRTQAATFESTTWVGHVWLEKVSTGTSVTLEVNCNQSPSSDFTWAMHGARLLPP